MREQTTITGKAGPNRRSNAQRVRELNTAVEKARLSDEDLRALAQERAYNAITDVCRAAAEASLHRHLPYSVRMELAKAVADSLAENRMLY